MMVVDLFNVYIVLGGNYLLYLPEIAGFYA